MNAYSSANKPLPAPPSPHTLAEEGQDLAELAADHGPTTVAAAHWLVRQQNGLSPEEVSQFDAWLAADPVHSDALRGLECTWRRMDEIPSDKVHGLKAELAGSSVSWRALAVRKPGTEPHRLIGRLRRFIDVARFVPQLAAAALAFAVLGGGWMGWEFWQTQPVYQQRLMTVRGVQQPFTLPDGSTVWLDTATQADVALYRDRREVRLKEGQVHISVSPDGRRPFRVQAGTTEVTVVGTRFTVRRTASGVLDSGVAVAVEEGRVRVAQRQAAGQAELGDVREALVLTAGQSATVDASGQAALSDRSSDGDGAWRSGRISLSGTTLAEAVAEFERYGDTRVRIDDPKVAGMRVHGSFDLRRFDAFLKALPQVLPVRLRRHGDQVEVVLAD